MHVLKPRHLEAVLAANPIAEVSLCHDAQSGGRTVVTPRWT